MPKIKNIFAVILSLLLATCVLFFALSIIQSNSADTLSQINSYQSEYFRIIKRHNVLLQVSENNSADKDLQDLSNLYKKVESKINPNCEFLKQYHNIEQQYANNTGETTVEMNDFAGNHYQAVDKLLNDTYKAVKQKIPQEDFNKLVESELTWLNEVENYRQVFDKQEFGTIGGLVYINYQIDMRNFRTLLLMLYL